MKQNQNLKNGLLTKEELELYEVLTEKEINTIMKYQEKLPVLQQENDIWINTRDLHKQLEVKRDYTTWIKQQIEDLGLEEEEYNLTFTFKGERKNVKVSNYFTTVETAKQIAMVSGAKGGRTNKELKENSKIVRKYFIYIEKAFRNREEWNEDRNETLLQCTKLKEALSKYRQSLTPFTPEWFYGNVFKSEFCLLNEVIIGMSATNYRKINQLKSSIPIRNTFTEEQLEYVHILEGYDADLINIQNIFNREQRKEILTRKFELDLKTK